MKKFRYRLEALLKVKEHIEKERQKELAESQQRVFSQEETLGEIDRTRDATYSKQRDKMSGTISVAEMLLYSRYFVKLKGDTISGREVLRALREESNRRRDKLLSASRDKKTYEKLKEKKKQQYLDEFQAIESKEENEIALQTYRLNK